MVSMDLLLYFVLTSHRFGSDTDAECMTIDEHLYKIVDRVKNFAVVYVVDIKGT